MFLYEVAICQIVSRAQVMKVRSSELFMREILLNSLPVFHQMDAQISQNTD